MICNGLVAVEVGGGSAKSGECRRMSENPGERGQKRGEIKTPPFDETFPTESFSVQNRFSPLFPRKDAQTGFFQVSCSWFLVHGSWQCGLKGSWYRPAQNSKASTIMLVKY